MGRLGAQWSPSREGRQQGGRSKPPQAGPLHASATERPSHHDMRMTPPCDGGARLCHSHGPRAANRGQGAVACGALLTCKWRLAYGVTVGDVFRALADPTRRLIVDELSERDGQTLFELCARLVHAPRRRQHPAGDQPAPRRAGGGRAASASAATAATSSTTSTRRRLRTPSRRWLPAPQQRGDIVRIRFTSIFVDDQEGALRFYTDVLGFESKADIPLGEGVRWLTVVSPQDPDGPELVLEPVDATRRSGRSRRRCSRTGSRSRPSRWTISRPRWTGSRGLASGSRRSPRTLAR